MSSKRFLLAALWSFALCLAAPAARADDRVPTPDERAEIEKVLQGQGYTSWDEIKMDDGAWKVEDARRADGGKYKVKLRPGSLDVLSAKRD